MLTVLQNHLHMQTTLPAPTRTRNLSTPLRIVLLCWLLSSCSTEGTSETEPTGDGGENPDVPAPMELLYFPPAESGDWETVAPSSLQWDESAIPELEEFLEESETRGFMILVQGRIAMEAYFNGHNAESFWYWASAGKTLTSAMVGIAQSEGYLSLSDPSSDYLGEGWTSASPQQEQSISIRDQLSMTTGLNETNFECTDPSCLLFLAPAGTRWAYHNGPYTLLQSVVSVAVEEDFDEYFGRKLRAPLGMNGFWFTSPEGNRVYYSNVRSMARFGLCVLAEGSWDGVTVLKDAEYVSQMRRPSQDLNRSYGYLWWLNGQDSYVSPGLPIELPGPIVPSAPADMFAGLGKNDQKVYVVPSLDMVVVRMGEDPGYQGLAITDYDNELWERINAVIGR